VAKKKASKKKAKAKARTKAKRSKAPRRRAAARGVIVTFEARHVPLIEALGRAYGCVASNGAVEPSAVIREVLDRFGHRLLRIAQPRSARDEEE
jgi:hypothetical protein